MKATAENVGVFVMLAGCLQVLQGMIKGVEEIKCGLSEVSQHLEAHHPVQQQQANDHALGAQEEMRNQVYLRFETGMKNFAAKQSGILRDQEAWLIHSVDSTVQKHQQHQSRSVFIPSTSTSFQNHQLQLCKSQLSKLDNNQLSIIEEIYFRSDYSIWMKNMMEHWIPERY
jgi:hypothetical protein